ncbi:scavenger receptor class B member 1 [Elysia marginata]|uniref:Scavenger receptor class B member 1 n=1 Tax=Elysia marginata TaxID=1093978 RepID=A0AAV4INW0_9GAST|nr:scavenger receptor class B member 1 [Elysia marginata]
MKFTCKRVTVLLLLTGLCVFTLLGRLKFDYMVNTTMEKQIKKHMALENGTESFKNWVDPPVPVLFQIYLFDIVNPMEVIKNQAPPVVMEKGPYVYKLHGHKENITYHDNYTVSFREPEGYTYVEELSVGPETDTFTSLNDFFFVLAFSLQNQSALVQNAVSDFFEVMGDSAFITRSLRDIWWGYDDVVLKKVADFLKSLHVNVTIPSKFGFNMDKNNTDGGVLTIYSGLSGNFDNFEKIDRWNGLRKLTSWNSDYANRIEGSDSSVQPPPLQPNKNLTFFDAHLQRTLNLVYRGPVQVCGVDAFRYVVPFSDFANAEDNPDNAGFCTPDVNHCLPSGALNLSVTSRGAPLVLSLPHFVGGDPYYQKQVRGMRPLPEKHQTFIEYHTLTGVNLRSARRYQVVMHVKPMKHFPAFSNLPEVYLPIMWIDGTSQIDDKTLKLFKTKMQDMLDMMVYVKGGMVGIVCLLALSVVALILYWTRKDRKSREASGTNRADDDDELLLPADPQAINTVYDDLHSRSPALRS